MKIIKCLVEKFVIDISFNQLSGLCSLCFLEEVDNLISRNHIFKRSVILIKAWCYHESRLLGSKSGLFSTYALEILVLYIFNLYNNESVGPLEPNVQEKIAKTYCSQKAFLLLVSSVMVGATRKITRSILFPNTSILLILCGQAKRYYNTYNISKRRGNLNFNLKGRSSRPGQFHRQPKNLNSNSRERFSSRGRNHYRRRN